MLEKLVPPEPTYRTQEEVLPAIRAACEANPDLAALHEIGTSEEGRAIYGVVLGSGPRSVSLIAGNHADEPVGPETLRTFLLEGLRRREALVDLYSRFRFILVPHTNPDGEARNRRWIAAWPDLGAYLRHVVRERPGRDMEFGFPDLRRENRAVAAFLGAHAPFALHMSLHGMAFSEGAMLLIERHWAARTQALRDGFAAAAESVELPLHDHNRKGEKGFFYIEPGFTTTPEGEAMRAFFRAQGDETTAALFQDCSMEFVRGLGGDPLCLVTELPLFLVERRAPHEPGVPAAYLALLEHLPVLQQMARHESTAGVEAAMGLSPLALGTAMRLQLRALILGLEAVPEPLPE